MQVKDVHSREDFTKFLETMAESLEDDRESWANPDLEDYLSAIARWTEGMEQFYKNTKQKMPEDIDWQFIAALFHIGKIYE